MIGVQRNVRSSDTGHVHGHRIPVRPAHLQHLPDLGLQVIREYFALNLDNQLGVVGAVRGGGRDIDRLLVAPPHPDDRLLEPGDDLTLADRELKGLVAGG